MHKLFRRNHQSLLRVAFPFTTIAAICFALLPFAHAVSPAPDGGYVGNNTAEGTDALLSLTGGVWNTAAGFEALKSETTGSTNTAIGFRALSANLDGHANTAVGSQALQVNSSGSQNIAIGAQAGINIATGSGNIDIGNAGSATDNNVIRIGRGNVQQATYVAGISGVPVVGTTVAVSSSGQLGVAQISSARFKDEIKPMDNASEAILALKPVTFRYKKELDPQGMPQFGLVAEDVAKVNPNLVTRDADGKLQTVRYDAVNAMLLNEFLKEHYTVQELKSTVAKQQVTIAQQRKDFEANTAQQQKEIQALTASLKDQAAQIQKVSAQLELSKPAPRTVSNNQ